MSRIDWKPGPKEEFIKRILLVSGIYPPDVGGPATYVPKLARHLVSNGHQVSVLALTDDVKLNPNSGEWHLSLVSRKIPLPIRIPWVAVRIAWLARDVDLIFANGLHQEVAISQFLINRPAVAKVVGDPVWERFRNKEKSSISIEDFSRINQNLGVRMQRRFLTWSLNRFAIVTAPSQALIDFLKLWGVSTPKLVIQNGTRCSESATTEEAYDAISVSRLVPWKNLDLLVEAAAEGNFRIAICGDGPEMNQLQELARAKGADATFLGELSSSRVQDELERAKCFVNISSYEGLSFSLIEAMMRRKACIVSNIEGNTAVITDNLNGLVIPLGSKSALVESIKFCISNPEKRKAFGENARTAAETNYCEEKQLDKMMNAIFEAYENK
jgi:glycosyltransferase involved in cell wall biosynthesis